MVDMDMMTTIVFLDIKIDDEIQPRIKIELFTKDLPKTTENFRQFCTGEYQDHGKPIGYKNSPIHRIISGFMIQGGDFIRGNGLGSKCIFGSDTFPDEGFPYDHKKYSLSMANSGPNSNGCQFFIVTDDAPHLDGKHVVFGKVIAGFETIDKLDKVKVDQNDKPKSTIIISECGEM
ncbi:cyclophilin type peptidyl-prolyl cis-trans isomerase [Scheffersomyces coipomensis]|uniref:cyclophilin type peptidyl-prolyl cis-trans isomerase n=1 Tax=Scheffersomyces coipomensis TaxID=1788519 RepID=UPI00315C93C1